LENIKEKLSTRAQNHLGMINEYPKYISSMNNNKVKRFKFTEQGINLFILYIILKNLLII
jgi:hypothetical protein